MLRLSWVISAAFWVGCGAVRAIACLSMNHRANYGFAELLPCTDPHRRIEEPSCEIPYRICGTVRKAMLADQQGAPAHPVLRALGRELRIARESRGLTQQQLAEQIHFSNSQISAVETGKRPARDALVVRADETLRTGGLLIRLLETAQEAAAREVFPDWFRPWHDIEETATALRSFQPLVVDGLLQTPEYARALLRAGQPAADAGTLDRMVEARMQRQRVFARDAPPSLVVVLDETVLRRPIGLMASVMRGQLDYLAEVGSGSRAEVHILPVDLGAHRGLAGAFVLASLNGAGDVAYVDTQLRGLVIESPSEVDEARRTWEALLGEALSTRRSIELIRSVAESWKI